MTKSSISFRACQTKIQVYRHQHRKQTRIFTLAPNLANAAELEILLANDVERRHWLKFKERHTATLIENRLRWIIKVGPDKVMGLVADALELLAEDDPSGKQPKNRQCGYGIWHQWDRVTRIVSSVSHWGIRQAEAKKQLELHSRSNHSETGPVVPPDTVATDANR